LRNWGKRGHGYSSLPLSRRRISLADSRKEAAGEIPAAFSKARRVSFRFIEPRSGSAYCKDWRCFRAAAWRAGPRGDRRGPGRRPAGVGPVGVAVGKGVGSHAVVGAPPRQNMPADGVVEESGVDLVVTIFAGGFSDFQTLTLTTVASEIVVPLLQQEVNSCQRTNGLAGFKELLPDQWRRQKAAQNHH
jgi:hypothetical protein